MQKINAFNTRKHTYKHLFFSSVIAFLTLLLGIGIFLSFEQKTQAYPYWSDSDIRASGFAQGSGDGSSEEKAYLISNAQQLGYFSYILNNGDDSYKNKYYKITNNINLIGNSWEVIKNFNGTFDGGGNYITSIIISERRSTVGFFGSLTNATVKNIMFEGMYNIASGELRVGGVAGIARNSTFSTVATNVTINAKKSNYVGGIVGRLDGEDDTKNIIEKSYNTGIINGDEYVGGLVGYANSNAKFSTEITNSYNVGNITGNGYIGGIIGYFSDLEDGYIIKNNFIYGKSFLRLAYNYGEIKGAYSTGGLIGHAANLDNLYALENKGKVVGGDRAGGIIGVNQNSSMSSFLNYGEVSGASKLGGVVGFFIGITKNSLISNTINNGDIKGNTNSVSTGGIVGESVIIPYHKTTTISMSFNSNYGNIVGGKNTGGIVGYVGSVALSSNTTDFHLMNSYNSGRVSGTTQVGGLIGLIEGESGKGGYYSIANTYNTGSISGKDYLGGLVGYANGIKPKTKNKTGFEFVKMPFGGHFSMFYTKTIITDEGSTISSSFSTGNVSGTTTSYVGALIGRNHTDKGSINKLYFLEENAKNKKGLGTSNGNGTNSSNGTSVVIADITSTNNENPAANFFEEGYINYNSGSESKNTANYYVLINSADSNLIEQGFKDEDVWATDSLINYGNPYLKDLYWTNSIEGYESPVPEIKWKFSSITIENDNASATNTVIGASSNIEITGLPSGVTATIHYSNEDAIVTFKTGIIVSPRVSVIKAKMGAEIATFTLSVGDFGLVIGTLD